MQANGTEDMKNIQVQRTMAVEFFTVLLPIKKEN